MNSNQREMSDHDVVIVGAGPAGCATALGLHDSGLKVLLIDKHSFPRDKICGDAISPDVVNQLRMLPVDLSEVFDRFEEKIPCHAVRFYSPDHSFADVRLHQHGISGYVSPRHDFDDFFFQQVVRGGQTEIRTEVAITGLEVVDEGVRITCKDGASILASVVVGADGANSIVARKLAKQEIDRNHHCAGLRQYWENVTGFTDDNAVELHFYKELLPGYFWMFPLPGNRANIGLGMLSSKIDKRGMNLKEQLDYIIQNHPNVKHRFEHAQPLEEIRGFGLPLGSKKRPLSGDHFLLTGDAASLINPLSGEGIGNAIRSGRVAAMHLKEAFEAHRFDAAFNQRYDAEVYRRLWNELRINYWVQLVMRQPALCNFIVRRAIGNSKVQDLIMSGFNIEKWTLRGLVKKMKRA